MGSKNIPTKHLLYMTLLLIAVISIAFFLDLPIYLGILASIVYIFALATYYGYSSFELLSLIKISFSTVKIVLAMLILIAAILPLWMSTGTLPTLIYYSFIHLSSLNVLLAAFLISSVLSLMLGTFIGTLSIVGPLFMSLAVGLEMPTAIVASALISGSVIGDRLSPISSNFHLICASCQSDTNKTLLAACKTNLPAFMIATLYYSVIGKQYKIEPSSYENIDAILTLLNTHFHIHYIMILPIILLLTLILTKKLPILWCFLVSLICSLGFYIYLGFKLAALPSLILNGYQPSLLAVHQLISGSGIKSMIAVPIIILCSAYLNDLLKHTNLMTQTLEHYSKGVLNTQKLYFRTSILSLIVTIISCNQSLTAIITGQHFQAHFQRLNIGYSKLARTIMDTGSLVITIIPWNLNALVAASITGVASIHYMPYMIYVYALLAITTVLPLFLKSKQVTSSKNVKA